MESHFLYYKNSNIAKVIKRFRFFHAQQVRMQLLKGLNRKFLMELFQGCLYRVSHEFPCSSL